MGFSYRLVGQDVSCLPGVAVVREAWAVCSRGSSSSGCWADGIGSLASSRVQSQGWHASCLVWLCQPQLAGRISSIKAGVLWRALQSLLCPPVCAMTLRTACCCLGPHFIPKLLSCWDFIHISSIWMFLGDGAWSMWSKWMEKGSGWEARGGVSVSGLPLPSWDNEMRPCGAESPVLVRWGELRGESCSILSLLKTCGEERSKQKDHSRQNSKTRPLFQKGRKTKPYSISSPKSFIFLWKPMQREACCQSLI